MVRISQNVLDNIPINGLEPTNSKHPVRLDSCGDGVGVGVGDADTLYLLVCGTTVPVLCGLVGEHRHSTSPCCGIHSHTGSTTSTASINCNRIAANDATDCCCGLWLCTLNGYLSGQWRVGLSPIVIPAQCQRPTRAWCAQRILASLCQCRSPQPPNGSDRGPCRNLQRSRGEE